MYFQLSINIIYDFGIHEPKNMPLEPDFMNGSSIEMSTETPMVFTTNASSGDKLPDFWDSGIPVMSAEFVKLVEGAGVDNIQKFPIVVKSDKDNTIWENYFAINIIGLVKCVDFDKSEYIEVFPGSFEFDTLAINAEDAKGYLLFRLQEDPSTILIHKSVGKYIGEHDPERKLVGWSARKVIQ